MLIRPGIDEARRKIAIYDAAAAEIERLKLFIKAIDRFRRSAVYFSRHGFSDTIDIPPDICERVLHEAVEGASEKISELIDLCDNVSFGGVLPRE
jgi:hypothetical protein